MAKSIVGPPGAQLAEIGRETRRENDGLAPPLLMSRPLALRFVLALGLPAVFGAICGLVLGIDKIAYLILSIPVAIAGGYVAGQEHDRAREGALRGLLGGAIFGAAILAAHAAAGTAAKTPLPHPHSALVGATAVFGAGLGALGARRRIRRREDDRDLSFKLSRLNRSEVVGFIGSGILLAALFMPWFATSCDQHHQPAGCNMNSMINGTRGSFNAFQTFKLLDLLLAAACAAPFILAYLIARGHELTWRPGEVTMIVGMVAFTLILLNGIILGRPGGDSPHNVAIDLKYGYLVGLAGAAMICFGGYVRQTLSIKSRKPPGVL